MEKPSTPERLPPSGYQTDISGRGSSPAILQKLIFRISVDNPEEPVAVERMWVVVRERIPGGYLGVLDNEPDSINENDAFWVGTELPFGPEHIINIMDRDAASISLARAEPRTNWPTQ